MLRRLALLLAVSALLASCARTPKPQPEISPPTAALGTWRGTATFRGARLDLSVRFFLKGKQIEATLSSPDLLLLDEPLDGVEATGPHVRFELPDEPKVTFVGMLEGDTLRGSAEVPAVTGVVEPSTERPQMQFALGRDRAPVTLPYATRELCIYSGAASLAGTLYVPRDDGKPRAGVVLLQGSSTNLRSEYAFYADRFAREGFAVLAFDKRGNGESTADYHVATYDTLVADAAAAVESLRAFPEVDPRRVGVWGLSQGAMLAPMVAARVPALAFIVAVSAPGLSIGECAAYQDSMRLASGGFAASEIRRATALDRQLLAWLQNGSGEPALRDSLASVRALAWRQASSVPGELPVGPERDGWYWRGRTIEPVSAWRAVRVPVLAVYGAADELIPSRASAQAVERALRKGGDPDITVRTFPNANHVIRTLPLVAGGTWDWPRAAPGYMPLVSNWLRAHTRAKP